MLDWRRGTGVVVAVMGLAGCISGNATSPTQETPTVSLVGPTWRLTSIGGQAVVSGTRIDAEFSTNERVAGTSGCNRYFGSAKAEAGRISMGPFGATLMASPDSARLYVANAWDKDVAVVSPASETVIGLIPTGWYPSAVAVHPDNRTLYVANMKGSRTFPRNRRRQALDFNVWSRERDSRIASDPQFGALTGRLWSLLRGESMKAIGLTAEAP